MGKISNVTNSTDPVSVNSRLFVGNLNTFALNKDAVETVFQRYGRIIGISMHKGFAFVQFTNEHDARKAVAGEDQRIYAGQQIDVNLSAEPKPMRASRKRQLSTGPEWDCFYNLPVVSGRAPLATMSIKTQADLAALQAFNAGAPPFKKAALLPLANPQPNIFGAALAPVSPSRLIRKPTRVLRVPKPFMAAVTATQKTGNNNVTASSPEPSASSEAVPLLPPTTSSPQPPISFPSQQTVYDILICGGCHQIFDEVDRLQLHKRNCTKTAQPRQPQLCHRCQCDAAAGDPIGPLKCASCDQQFGSCWQLCQHAQSEHDVHIFALPPPSPTNLNHRDTISDTGSNLGHIEDQDDIEHQNPLISLMDESKLVDTRISDAESESSLISPTMHNGGDVISATFAH